MYNEDLKDIMIANFNNINPGSSLTANSYNAMCNMLIDAINTHMENTEVIDRELHNLKDTQNNGGSSGGSEGNASVDMDAILENIAFRLINREANLIKYSDLEIMGEGIYENVKLIDGDLSFTDNDDYVEYVHGKLYLNPTMCTTYNISIPIKHSYIKAYLCKYTKEGYYEVYNSLKVLNNTTSYFIRSDVTINAGEKAVLLFSCDIERIEYLEVYDASDANESGGSNLDIAAQGTIINLLSSYVLKDTMYHVISAIKGLTIPMDSIYYRRYDNAHFNSYDSESNTFPIEADNNYTCFRIVLAPNISYSISTYINDADRENIEAYVCTAPLNANDTLGEVREYNSYNGIQNGEYSTDTCELSFIVGTNGGYAILYVSCLTDRLDEFDVTISPAINGLNISDNPCWGALYKLKKLEQFINKSNMSIEKINKDIEDVRGYIDTQIGGALNGSY